MTNLEGRLIFGENWKEVDITGVLHFVLYLLLESNLDIFRLLVKFVKKTACKNKTDKSDKTCY